MAQYIRSGFTVSHKGKYLYSDYYALDGNPLIVIEAVDGNVLWEHNINMFWEELLDEKTLAGVNQSGILRFLDMSSDNILVERNIGKTFRDELGHLTWSLSVSADGSYFTVLGRSGLSNNVWDVKS